MALPTPEPRAALSLDELINELNTPRQEFKTPENSERAPVPLPGDRSKIDSEAAERVSAETASAAGVQIAGLVTNGSQALCGFIGGEKSEKYKISAAQQRDLADSYGKVAAYYNMSETNPVLAAVILSLVILGPQFREAFSDRRIKKLEEDNKRIEAEQKRQALEMLRMREIIDQEKAKNLHNGTPEPKPAAE
jgi:hypothetical protein